MFSAEGEMDDIIAVVTDLFFQSRISAAARAAGRRVRYVTSPQALLPPARLCVVDLDARTDVLALIRRLKRESRAPIVAFGPHIDTAGRKAARLAGADRVLAKSKFVTELPRLMNQSPTATNETEAE
jgi:CheY-like chemotaxis protein